MTTVPHNTPAVNPSPPSWRTLLPDLLGPIVPLAAVATATATRLDVSTAYGPSVSAAYGLLVLLLVRALPPDLPGVGLGGANRVTLLRATLVLPLAPLPVLTSSIGIVGSWWVVLLATLSLLLDGADGWTARRWGASSFGARFDMELDAFLILVLSALVWRTGRTGPWVVLIGAMRYLFVAGGWVWPCLRADLPPSWRRKTTCVVQGVALVTCLAPVVSPSLAWLVAAAALLTLTWSFWIDVRLLVRSRPVS